MGDRDYWKMITGKTLEEATMIPTHQNILDKQWASLHSKYPLINLGTNQDGEFFVSEEERESHFHIIGSTGEGKSYFLQHLLRHDIHRGQGLCFLDPTGGAKTLKDILRYCAKINHPKVCLIDPYHYIRYRKVPVINPLLSDSDKPWLHKYSIANVLDAFRVLFGVKDASETARIQFYMKALLRLLVDAGMTLHEAKYFTLYEPYRSFRDQLYEAATKASGDSSSRTVMSLEGAFRTPTQFNVELGSTVRRLDTIFDEPLSWMFGSNEPRRFIDFQKMVGEGWVILVNLDTDGGLEPLHMRFIGTVVINEIISSIHRLNNAGWKKKYYLYIDEAGEYANRKLQEILDYKRNLGLRLVIAHQHFNQFEDKKVLNSINSNAKFKVAFYTGREDRDNIVRMMYGGDLNDRDVSYALSQMKRQHAVIKNNKQPPRVIKIEDVEPVDVSKEDLETYIQNIYLRPWYKSPAEIGEEIRSRIKPSDYDIRTEARQRVEKRRSQPSKARTDSDRKADGGAAPPERKSLLDFKE